MYYRNAKNVAGHMKMRGRYFSKLSLDGIKPNTNPKTNPNPNTNPNSKLTLILTLFSCFRLFFEHRPLIFSLANVAYSVMSWNAYHIGTPRCITDHSCACITGLIS